MKIVYFGTPEFAASQLDAILNAGFDVVAVVTTPDKPAGRGKKIHCSEVKECALKHGLPVLQPEKLREFSFVDKLHSLHADLFVVVAFRMLPELIWKMPPMGTINLHASLLPQYRGAAPINHAIINGETRTGLTTFFLDKEIDTGAVILQKPVPIDENDDAGTLHDKLMLEGNKVIVETIKMIENGCANAISQNRIFDADTIVLKPAPKIFKNDCYINWNKQKNEIKNFVRGLSPYPAAHALLKNGDEEILDLKIFEVEIEEKNDCDVPDFKVITDGKSFLKVVLRDGFVKILKIQQPGKKVMPIADFLIGARLSEDLEIILKA